LNKRISNRRSFLKTITAGAAGALAAPYVITSNALGNASILPASERITLAHIGVGGQGSGLLKHFLGLNDCQSVAICDPFRNRREGRAQMVNDRYAQKYNQPSYKACQACNDFRSIMARDDVDAVVIATPDHWHVPIALAAARAGKDMYVEKPLGLSVEQNIILRREIKQYGVIFQYGTQQRAQSHLHHGCELVRNGRLGKIHSIEVVAPGGVPGGSTRELPIPEGFDYDLWQGPAPVAPYTNDRCIGLGRWFCYDYAIGFLGGWGAHPLDILDWVFNHIEPNPVEFEGTGVIPTEGLFDTVTTWKVHCKYANGVKMTFVDGLDSTKFIGDQGWIRMGRGHLSAGNPSILKDTIGPNEVRLHKSNDHKQDLLNCIKTRSRPASHIDTAVRSDTISHLSDIAIRTGRKIKWDPIKEEIVGDEAASRMLSRPMRTPWRL